jgi:hypothetical protein
MGRIDGKRGFQIGKNVLRIGRNTFYDQKNKIPMKIPEFKRSGIGLIAEFRGILNGFPNLGTSNDIYMTPGQVPETIMMENTTGISNITEFGWYDWVMFRDNEPSYPDDKLILGRYLGPAIDTGSALTAKILISNGVFV